MRDHGLHADNRVVVTERTFAETVLALGAPVEQIKRFTVLPVDWLPGGEELTPTMKLERKPIATRYAAEIETMYA